MAARKEKWKEASEYRGGPYERTILVLVHPELGELARVTFHTNSYAAYAGHRREGGFRSESQAKRAALRMLGGR